MSCELRISGSNFNVDEFVEKTGIKGFRKGYKGDLISKFRDKRLEYSYVSITISNAPFSEIKIQIKEAEAFLLKNESGLKNIAITKEIDFAGIDFGADSFMENGMVKSFYFPPSLILICAELKLGLELSIYSA